MLETAAVPETRVKTRALYLAARTLWFEPPTSGELIVRPSARQFMLGLCRVGIKCIVLLDHLKADAEEAALQKFELCAPLSESVRLIDIDRLHPEFALADYWVLTHQYSDSEGRDQLARALMDVGIQTDHDERMELFIRKHFMACRRFGGGDEQVSLMPLCAQAESKFRDQDKWERDFFRALENNEERRKHGLPVKG